MVNIAVIGAGVGGVLTIQYLKDKLPDSKFFLIDKEEHFVFTPRLTELFSESINKEYIVAPKTIFKQKNVEVVKSNAKKVDLRKQEITLQNKRKIIYDYIIFSQGAKTNFFGKEKLKKKTFPFKTEAQVENLKKQIKKAISKINSKKLEEFKIAIVGGGATGTELAFAFRDYTKVHSIKENNSHKKIKVSIFQSGKNLVPYWDKKIIEMAEKAAKKEDIEVVTGKRTVNIKNKTLIFEDKTSYKADIIVWVAGVTPNVVETEQKLELKNGAIPVMKTLQLKDHENAFAIGDCAYVIDPKGKPYAPTAQNASQEAEHAAKNILRRINKKPLKDFNYKTRGVFLALGKNKTIAQVYFLVFDGILGWILRDSYYKFIFNKLTKS